MTFFDFVSAHPWWTTWWLLIGAGAVSRVGLGLLGLLARGRK